MLAWLPAIVLSDDDDDDIKCSLYIQVILVDHKRHSVNMTTSWTAIQVLSTIYCHSYLKVTDEGFASFYSQIKTSLAMHLGPTFDTLWPWIVSLKIRFDACLVSLCKWKFAFYLQTCILSESNDNVNDIHKIYKDDQNSFWNM